TPSLASVSPRALEILSPTACLPLTLSGQGFLLGAEVTVGGIQLPASTFNVLSATTIQVTAIPPSLPVGLHKISVRNVDEQVSPEVGGPALLGAFQLDLQTVAITGTDQPSFLEGTVGALVNIDGICPSVSTLVNGVTESLSLLDPAIGPTLLNLGSVLQGSVVNLPAPLSPVVTILAPGIFRLQAPMPPFPPGLANLPGGSQGGLTNTGLKHWQITPAFCINPPAFPHRFPSPGTTEPNNLVRYTASGAPAVVGFEPTDYGRLSGGQFILVRGTDFLTNAPSLPSSDLSLNPVVLFADAMGILPPFPAPSVEMLDSQTLRVQPPNLTALGPALPYLTSVRVFNPDLQASPATIASRYP
ncbi:MAG TPA: hypothetical protein PKA37_18300, partial [Planctomycetota bacterium]|nr:hypothetical protein [Planctomycetota bacterium]